MQARFFQRLSWHSILCGVAGGVFLATSAPRVLKECRGPIGPVAPFHTTDYFLTALLGAPGGSERLIHVFSALPPGEPVAVIVPENDWANAFTGLILGYFGWPREVRIVPIRRDNADANLQALQQAPLAAIFFSGVNPPTSAQPVIPLGRDLVVVPAPVKKQGRQ